MSRKITFPIILTAFFAGAWLMPNVLSPALAQDAPTQFTECMQYQVGFVPRLSAMGKPMAMDKKEKWIESSRTALPAGWTPVGGPATSGMASVVLCR